MLEWFKDRNNITLTIAIAGFVMSLITWIYTFVSQRQKLKFHIYETKTGNGVTFFFIQMENCSRLPIAITRIQLVLGKKYFDCVAIPQLVYQSTHRSGKEITSQKSFYSLQMPIEISSLGAISGYILFENPKAFLPADSTEVTLLICTNRGKKEEISLPLSSDFQCIQ